MNTETLIKNIDDNIARLENQRNVITQAMKENRLTVGTLDTTKIKRQKPAKNGKSKKRKTVIEFVVDVLTETKKPTHYKDIVDACIRNGYKSPTLKQKDGLKRIRTSFYQALMKHDQSKVKRCEKGMFELA